MSLGARSPYLGHVAIPAGSYGSKDPIDAGHAHQAAADLQHLADSAGQVRVAWAAVGAQYLTTATVDASNKDLYLPIAAFGPFPLRLDSDGAAYSVRARIAGAASAANAVTFRCAIAPAVSAPRRAAEEIGRYGLGCLQASTSSTSSAWLTATGSRTLLVVDGVLADEAIRTMTSVAAAGSATRTADVQEALFVAHVWAMSTAAATQAQLTGLYLAEYVGAAP